MSKFRKKPVVIEAEEFLHPDVMTRLAGAPNPGKIPEGVRQATAKEISDNISLLARVKLPARANALLEIDDNKRFFVIETLEGLHFVSHQDWVITGVKGERYPCKPDIFVATYDPVEDP